MRFLDKDYINVINLKILTVNLEFPNTVKK